MGAVLNNFDNKSAPFLYPLYQQTSGERHKDSVVSNPTAFGPYAKGVSNVRYREKNRWNYQRIDPGDD